MESRPYARVKEQNVSKAYTVLPSGAMMYNRMHTSKNFQYLLTLLVWWMACGWGSAECQGYWNFKLRYRNTILLVDLSLRLIHPRFPRGIPLKFRSGNWSWCIISTKYSKNNTISDSSISSLSTGDRDRHTFIRIRNLFRIHGFLHHMHALKAIMSLRSKLASWLVTY